MIHLLPSFICCLSLVQGSDEQTRLQGTWRITALVEDGQTISEKDVAREYITDGEIQIQGNTVVVRVPGQFEPRRLAFVLDGNAEPKRIDLAGTQKIGSKGIYMNSGNSLILCIGLSDADSRPSDFSASFGTKNMMIALQRVNRPLPTARIATTSVSVPSTPAPTPPAAPKVPSDSDLRRRLIGTWGTMDDRTTRFTTFNPDGTFSTSQDWNRGLKRVFDLNVRSSGTWTIEDGVVVTRISASSDFNRKGQIYSSRITSYGDREMFSVDQDGVARRFWKAQ